MKQNRLQKGFTLVELLMVMGIAAILMTFVTINLVKAQRNTSVTAEVDRLIADLKSQQVKAMNGSSWNGAFADAYGIHIGPNNYVLFHGIAFNSADPDNFTAGTDGTVNFSSNFNSNDIVFTQRTGAIYNFSPAQNTFTITNISGSEQRTVTLNKYGVVIDIN